MASTGVWGETWRWIKGSESCPLKDVLMDHLQGQLRAIGDVSLCRQCSRHFTKMTLFGPHSDPWRQVISVSRMRKVQLKNLT